MIDQNTIVTLPWSSATPLCVCVCQRLSGMLKRGDWLHTQAYCQGHRRMLWTLAAALERLAFAAKWQAFRESKNKPNDTIIRSTAKVEIRSITWWFFVTASQSSTKIILSTSGTDSFISGFRLLSSFRRASVTGIMQERWRVAIYPQERSRKVPISEATRGSSQSMMAEMYRTAPTSSRPLLCPLGSFLARPSLASPLPVAALDTPSFDGAAFEAAAGAVLCAAVDSFFCNATLVSLYLSMRSGGTHSSQLDGWWVWEATNVVKRKHARLLPTFVMYKIMRPNRPCLCVCFVPCLRFQNLKTTEKVSNWKTRDIVGSNSYLGLIDEWSMVTEHTFVDSERGVWHWSSKNCFSARLGEQLKLLRKHLLDI